MSKTMFKNCSSLAGNIVTPDGTFYGEISWDAGQITRIRKTGDVRPGTDWILAGFIDVHFHGLGAYSAEKPDQIEKLAEFAPETGVTTICPALASAPREKTLQILTVIRDASRKEPAGAKIAGTHLEGPYLSYEFRGGMAPDQIRMPDPEEMEAFLAAGEDTVKIVTISPELPGALDMIRALNARGITVSSGHSACPPAMYEDAVSAGVTQFCHLYDAYADSTTDSGVRQPALTDLALIDDRVMKEIIMDGLHVPPELIHLARRAAGAEHIIAITDAMQGAGLKYGRFCDGNEWYIIREGELARRESDNAIVGSSLSMNLAFFNMTERFGFSPSEATLSLSANPAKALHLDDRTGRLQTGLAADITVLDQDRKTVKATFVNGNCVFDHTAV